VAAKTFPGGRGLAACSEKPRMAAIRCRGRVLCSPLRRRLSRAVLGCRVLQGAGSAVGPYARGVGRVCSDEGLPNG
jgi:hypothetical protein